MGENTRREHVQSGLIGQDIGQDIEGRAANAPGKTSLASTTQKRPAQSKPKAKALPRGVTLRDTGDNQTIYINFTYQGVRCREPLTGWQVDGSNITAASNLRGAILTQINNKTFHYADHFPHSNKLAIFGGALSQASVGHYLDKVVSQAIARGLKPSSIQTYQVRVKDLKARVGSRSVAGFDEGDVRDLALTLAQTQKFESIKNTLKVLKSALHEAVIEGAVGRDPFATFKLAKYVKRPSKKVARAGIAPFTPAELAHLVASCQDEGEALLLRAWACCGFRNGELCALRWCDVDLAGAVISIEENYVSHVAQTGTPKTEGSVRDIHLDQAGVAIFKALRALANTLRARVSPRDLVFINAKSTRANGGWDNYALRRLFVRLYKSAGVAARKIYNMRHTYAVRRISQGHNLWDIAQQMGHNSPDMLFQTYGQFMEEYRPDQGQNAAKRPTGDTLKSETGFFH